MEGVGCGTGVPFVCVTHIFFKRRSKRAFLCVYIYIFFAWTLIPRIRVTLKKFPWVKGGGWVSIFLLYKQRFLYIRDHSLLGRGRSRNPR